MKKGGNVKTEYLTAGGSLTNGSPRTLKSRPSESLSTKKRFFILYLGNYRQLSWSLTVRLKLMVHLIIPKSRILLRLQLTLT